MKKSLLKTTRLGLLVVFTLTHCLLLAQTNRTNSPKNESSVQGLAQSNSNGNEKINSSQTENQSPFDAVKGKREDKSKRDAFSKHYINDDGSFTALIGAGPIHFEKNGQFLDIDHNITSNFDSNFPYANTTNLFESYFGATSHTGVKNKTAEGEIQEFLNTKMYWEINGQAVNTQNSANRSIRIEGDKAYYDNIFGNISAEFTTLTGKRKLNYIIPNQQALGNIPSGVDFLVFTEDVILPFGWTSSITESGVMIKDQLGKEIYLYESPVSTDANNELRQEENTVFETYQLGNTLTIKTKVKTAWLLSNERQFPVMVDPTVSVNTINSNSTGQCWPAGGGYGNPYVGYNGGWYRSWVTFNLSSLPALSKGSVSSVSTSLYVRSKLGTAGTHTVRIGHSKFDLASTTYFPTFSGKYNGMTDPVNAAGAYGEIPMSATLNQYATANLSIDSYEVIEKQTGTANAFFPISLSPSWGTGTTNRGIGFYGHGISGGTPILTINYSIPDTHCRSTHTSSNCAGYGDCQYIGISNVNLGTINNTTPFNNAPNGYNNYSNISTDISEGTTYNLSITYRDNGSNQGQLAAWIDWNSDGDFNDANEYLGVFNNRTNNQVTTFSVNVPSGTTTGIKRLRIRSVYQGEGLSATDACTTKQYGETEDYSLNVLVPENPTLTISEAYTGASHADGSYTFDNDTPLVLSSGTRIGYNAIGWTGTGSVPATGTTGDLVFNITQNSSIEWLWEAIQPEFHNYGGEEQLAFNNSKINAENPVFRLSHDGGDANDYQIQISNTADFSSGTVSQTFNGTYPANTENNFTFTNGSFTSGITYYVRAAVDMGGGYLTDGWTTETYSFTYQSPQEIPDWFQTTQAQFQSNELLGVTANTSHNVVTNPGGNLVVNGDFTAGNTTGWTLTGNNSTGKVVAVRTDDHINFPGNWLGIGTGSTVYQSASGTIVVSQEIDLTNVTEISFKGGAYHYVSCCTDPNPNTKLEFKIGGTLTDINGNIAATLTQGSNNRQDQTVNVSSYIGVQVIKFVMTYNSNWNGNGVARFYIDDIEANAPPQGTITSTPIHLASVQEAIGYAGVRWNQTLGTGDFNLSVQGSNDGTNFTDISGFTNISIPGDGEKFVDLSGLTTPPPHIRLVGNLDGETVVLHDWAVEFLKITDDCPTSTTWNGTSWSNGAPNELTERIIFEGNFTSTLTNTDSGNLTGCSLEVLSGNVVISSGHNVTLDKEIKVSGGSFTLENEASLVQIQADAMNTGNITVKRNTTEMVKFDATYWSSPVSGQNLKGFSSATLNNRFYIYNGYNAAPEGISPHFKAVFVNDANYPMPPSIPGEWNVPTDELIGNLFRMDAYTFKPGWGYSIRVPNNWPHPLGTAGGILAEEFTGIPHNGNINVPAYGKYTMVGNPYPSPIQTMGESGFFKANANVETLHFWTHHFDVTQLPEYNSNYVTFTRIGDAGLHPGGNGEATPNGIISVAQGFVVENSTIPQEQSPNKWDVVFTNEMRTTEQGIFIKPFDEEIEKHRFWLSVSDVNERKLAQILVGYMTDATYEFDHQIDGRRLGTAPLFSRIGEEAFTVQGRTLPFEIEDVVKLGFTAHVDGKFKIGLDNFDGFFSDEIIRIYVRDHLNQIEHDLMSADYWFESEEGEFPTRFEIIYKTEEVLANEELDKNQVIIYHNPNNIVIQSQKEKILEVELWDLSGKKLHQNKKVNANSYEIKRTHFGTQVLLVKVLTANGEITSKKIINY